MPQLLYGWLGDSECTIQPYAEIFSPICALLAAGFWFHVGWLGRGRFS
jgi:hypothetical protein